MRAVSLVVRTPINSRQFVDYLRGNLLRSGPPIGPVDERQIVGGLNAGDANAAEEFVRTYGREVTRAVRNGGVPRADVPDVAQEVMIEAIRQLSHGGFQHRSSIRTWLQHIVRGRIADYWRWTGRRGRGRHLPIEDAEPVPDFFAPAAQGIRLLVEQTLASMPARHRVALVAHCRGRVPVEELARTLGLSVSRTRNVITEAKGLFRDGVCGTTHHRLRLPRTDE